VVVEVEDVLVLEVVLVEVELVLVELVLDVEVELVDVLDVLVLEVLVELVLVLEVEVELVDEVDEDVLLVVDVVVVPVSAIETRSNRVWLMKYFFKVKPPSSTRISVAVLFGSLMAQTISVTLNLIDVVLAMSDTSEKVRAPSYTLKAIRLLAGVASEAVLIAAFV